MLMQTCIMRARDECREREREGERKEQALPNGCFSFPDTERPQMSPQPKLPSRESKGVRRLQGKEKKKRENHARISRRLIDVGRALQRSRCPVA